MKYQPLSMPTRLYIKQCSHCSLKYFGKTTNTDVINYAGSGVAWKYHLKQHNAKAVHLWNSDWYTTTKITRFALLFSVLNKIVDNPEWANLINENGIDGGDTSESLLFKYYVASRDYNGVNNPFYGKKHTEEVKQLLSVLAKKQWTGVPKTEEHKAKISKALKGRKLTDERKQKISASLKGRTAHNKGIPAARYECEFCGKIVGGASNYKRWHGDNCRNKT